MIPGPKLLLTALALLTLSSACSWSQPPRVQDAIIPPMAVQDPLFKRSTGKIFLLPEGIWSFIPDASENAFRTMQPGDLIAFNPSDDTLLPDQQPPRHIFAIVTKRDWGFLLQRLDSQPITRNARGALSPLSSISFDDATAEAAGEVCYGTAHDLNNPCLTDQPLARFDIYAASHTDETAPTFHRLQIQNPPEAHTLTMPILRQALLYVDAQNTPKIFAPAELPERWIAIRATQTAITPDQISLVTNDTCPSLEQSGKILSGLTIHHRTLASLPHATHPLEVEAAAYQHAADALLWCAPDAKNPAQPGTQPGAKPSATIAATPAIHHPFLIARGQYILGSSTLGLRPIHLSTNPAQRALLAQITALSSRAHFELADFALEILLQSQPDAPQPLRQLAIQTMQLTASAGRPEAALRQGWFATRETWNRDGDPLYMLGQAAAFAAFDLNAEYSKLIQRFSETLKSANDTNLVAWLIYDDFRRKIAAGTEIPLLEFENIEKSLVARKLDTWALTIRALAIQHELQNQNTVPASALEILQKAFADRNLTPLWHAYFPQSPTTPLDCTDNARQTSCNLDSFGRRLAHIRAENPEEPARLIGQLRQTPRVELRPNFSIDALHLAEITAPSTRARLILAAFPLLNASDKSTILPELSQSLAHTLRDSPAQDTCTDLSQIQALGHELLLRATGPQVSPAEQTTARNAAWLANEAFPAACHSLAKFEETTRNYVRQHPRQSAAPNHLVVPFFDSLLARAAAQSSTDTARALARLTTELGNNEPCRRYNLALAAALARAGQLDNAQHHLLLAGNCSQSQNTFYVDSHNLILNYIAYERSGNWPNNKPPQALSSATQPGAKPDDHCIAFGPESFDILRYLEPEIAQLAAQLQLPAASTSPGFLQLRLSSAAIAQGEASYQVARRALSEGRPHVAASLLAEARADFISSSHLSGIARVAFLEATLFNNDLASFSQPTSQSTRSAAPQSLLKTAPAALPELFRSGFARAWLEQFDATPHAQRPQIPPHLFIAASLLVEDPAQTQNRVNSLPENTKTPHFQTLCEFSNPNDRLLHEASTR